MAARRAATPRAAGTRNFSQMSFGSVPVNSLALIDASTGRLKEGIAVGGRPTAVAVGEGSVWVANFDEQTVSRVDPVTMKEVTRIPAGGAPTGQAAPSGQAPSAVGLCGSRMVSRAPSRASTPG